MKDKKDKDPNEQARTSPPDSEQDREEGGEQPTVELLMQSLEALRKERDEYYDLLLRKQAEFENYRKRTNKERDESRIAAIADLSKELLVVLDAAEKGLETLRGHGSDQRLAGYREGYELLLRSLRAVLGKFGVRELSAVGEKFDPSLHEAVNTHATSEHEEGQILEEYRKGYTISDRLLRPAQVKVAVPGSQASK